MIGAVMGVAGGVLMLLGFGAAQYAHTAALVFGGAMFLLLATLEKGDDKRPLRTRLLVLFFLLLLGNLRLPPLDFLEAAAMPLLAVLYGKKGDGPLTAILLLLEVALAVLRTLATTGYLKVYPLEIVGAVLVATAVLRFIVLLRLNRRAARDPVPTGEVHTLR